MVMEGIPGQPDCGLGTCAGCFSSQENVEFGDDRRRRFTHTRRHGLGYGNLLMFEEKDSEKLWGKLWPVRWLN